MPITKSAKKALRQNAKRYVKNLRTKRTTKGLVKAYEKTLDEKDSDKARALLPGIQKALDKAVKLGIMKKNTASRKKSRLAKKSQAT